MMFLAVRSALIDAVRSGRLPGERLEQAAARVAELRAWMTSAASARAGDSGAAADPERIGLAAARRAVQVTGTIPALHRPLVVQLVPPSNMAAGYVPWGLSSWVPEGSTLVISTGTPDGDLPELVSRVLAGATGRSLVIVVRDAHRYPLAAAAVGTLLASRPDAVVVEMGLPNWRPPAASYLASYGAARSSGRAVAEILGLAGQPQEPTRAAGDEQVSR
jgi:beta-N-acetylhexosaminidase